MLPTYVHTFTFILAMVALVGCLGRFDYNIVLALGWLYLGQLHPSLTSSLAVRPTISSSM